MAGSNDYTDISRPMPDEKYQVYKSGKWWSTDKPSYEIYRQEGLKVAEGRPGETVVTTREATQARQRFEEQETRRAAEREAAAKKATEVAAAKKLSEEGKRYYNPQTGAKDISVTSPGKGYVQVGKKLYDQPGTYIKKQLSNFDLSGYQGGKITLKQTQTVFEARSAAESKAKVQQREAKEIISDIEAGKTDVYVPKIIREDKAYKGFVSSIEEYQRKVERGKTKQELAKEVRLDVLRGEKVKVPAQLVADPAYKEFVKSVREAQKEPEPLNVPTREQWKADPLSSAKQLVMVRQEQIQEGYIDPLTKKSTLAAGFGLATAGVIAGGLNIAQAALSPVKTAKELGKTILTKPSSLITEPLKRIQQEPISGIAQIGTELYLAGKIGAKVVKTIKKPIKIPQPEIVGGTRIGTTRTILPDGKIVDVSKFQMKVMVDAKRFDVKGVGVEKWTPFQKGYTSKIKQAFDITSKEKKILGVSTGLSSTEITSQLGAIKKMQTITKIGISPKKSLFVEEYARSDIRPSKTPDVVKGVELGFEVERKTLKKGERYESVSPVSEANLRQAQIFESRKLMEVTAEKITKEMWETRALGKSVIIPKGIEVKPELSVLEKGVFGGGVRKPSRKVSPSNDLFLGGGVKGGSGIILETVRVRPPVTRGIPETTLKTSVKEVYKATLSPKQAQRTVPIMAAATGVSLPITIAVPRQAQLPTQLQVPKPMLKPVDAWEIQVPTYDLSQIQKPVTVLKEPTLPKQIPMSEQIQVPLQMPKVIQMPIQKPVQEIVQRQVQLPVQKAIQEQLFMPFAPTMPTYPRRARGFLSPLDVDIETMKMLKPLKRGRKKLETSYLPSFIALSKGITAIAPEGFDPKRYVGTGLEIRPIVVRRGK